MSVTVVFTTTTNEKSDRFYSKIIFHHILTSISPSNSPKTVTSLNTDVKYCALTYVPKTSEALVKQTSDVVSRRILVGHFSNFPLLLHSILYEKKAGNSKSREIKNICQILRTSVHILRTSVHILRTSVYILRTFCAHSAHILCTFCAHSVHILCTFCVLLCTFCAHCAYFSAHSVHILRTSVYAEKATFCLRDII